MAARRVRRHWINAWPAAAIGQKILVVVSRFHLPQCARNMSHGSLQSEMLCLLVIGKARIDKPYLFAIEHYPGKHNQGCWTNAVQPKTNFGW